MAVKYCNCSTVPLFNDTVYGGPDVRTAGTEWRRLELAALMNSYRLSGTRMAKSGEPWGMSVSSMKRGEGCASTCDDAFFALLIGTWSVRNVDFEVSNATNKRDTCCEYQARVHATLPAGSYALHIWLTYTNGSGVAQPTRVLAPVLATHEKELLVRRKGRLKDVPIIVESIMNRSDVTRSFMYSFAGTRLHGTPWVVQVSPASAGAPDRRHRYNPVPQLAPIEPLCTVRYRGRGAWMRREACMLDPSCSAQGAGAFYSDWVWKPDGCRLQYFASFADFETALLAKLRHSRVPHRRQTERVRVVMAGESLMREDFCALAHFASGRLFDTLDCGKALTQNRVEGRVATFIHHSVAGFYEEAFGLRLPNRTDAAAAGVCQVARNADLVLWSDVGHTFEKNPDAYYIRAMLQVTALLATCLPNTTVSWRPQTYVHNFGPAAFHSEGSFYRWGYFLQGPRIMRANHHMQVELTRRGLPIQFDPSHMQRARPDLTRDRMHSTPTSSIMLNGRTTPCCLRTVNSTTVLSSAKETCESYCAGRWEAFNYFVNVAPPILGFYTMQLTLNWVLQAISGSKGSAVALDESEVRGNRVESSRDALIPRSRLIVAPLLSRLARTLHDAWPLG